MFVGAASLTKAGSGLPGVAGRFPLMTFSVSGLLAKRLPSTDGLDGGDGEIAFAGGTDFHGNDGLARHLRAIEEHLRLLAGAAVLQARHLAAD